MKLAEALNLRKKLDSDFNRLLILARGTDQPVASVFQSLLEIYLEQGEIVARIERTNFAVSIRANNKTLCLTVALCHRHLVKEFISKSEPLISADKSGEILRQLDAFAAQCKELDEAIQQANWSTDLI